MRYSNDNTLTVEIANKSLNKVQIPFYLIFRALGWSSDKDMLDWIVYDYDNDANKDLLNILVGAMNAKYSKINYKSQYNQIETIKHIIDLMPPDTYKYLDLRNKPEHYHNAVTDVLNLLDTHMLPHIGMTHVYRNEKLKFLGLLIRKLILVFLRHIPQTDRDSYRNKRIHAAGDNYAKVFKTFFNQAFVMPIKRRMVKDFNSAPFAQVHLANMVKASVFAEDFGRLIRQTIVSGNKSMLKIKRRHIPNRLSTQQLHRKNQLNVLATMRQITSTSAESAKQSERASEMRRVHMSALGYICVNHTPPEGEKVGINKQMAIFTTVAQASSSEVLKKILAEEKLIVHEGVLRPIEIYRGNYARVYVNGHLIGYTANSIELINKYRKLRRQLVINPHTTIFWDNVQDEVQFFVDIGRLIRPLLIVYNNQRDTDVVNLNGSESKFKQGIAITSEDIHLLYQRKKTIEDLLREQKVEFITPEEQECCYICPSLDKLYEDSENQRVNSFYDQSEQNQIHNDSVITVNAI
jgi:DNA-directed RNA polymerase beta subunit